MGKVFGSADSGRPSVIDGDFSTGDTKISGEAPHGFSQPPNRGLLDEEAEDER